METLGRIEIFVEVARQQSFAKAARALGMSGPAASKQVIALEDELGVKLLHRTTRMVTLTDEGAIYYDRARLALEELKDAASQLHEMKEAPSGILRVSAPLSFGHMHLLPVFASFAKKYPEVKLEISLDDRKVDVLAEGFDVAIRIGALKDSGLIARHMGNCPIYLVAAPAYIKAHGKPKTPAELRQHRFIAFSVVGGAAQWRYRDPRGKVASVQLESAFRANTAEMMLEAALSGVGIALLPIFSVGTHIKAKQLVQLLPEYDTYPTSEINALTPPNRYRSTKVRLLLDWVSQACKAMPLT